MKLRVPLPVPNVVDPSVIHETDAAAVQEQLPGAVTGIWPVPPAAGNDCEEPTEPGHTDAGAYETLTLNP